MVFEQYISNNYLLVFLTFVAYLFLFELGTFIFFKIFGKISSKTKSSIDNILAAKFRKPLHFLFFFLALTVTIRSVGVDFPWLSSILTSIKVFQAILIAYFSYIFFDVVIIGLLERFASNTKTDIDDVVVSILSGILRIGVFVVFALYVISLFGFSLGPLLAGLGIGGIAIALALQPVLSNIFSGLSVVLDKSIRKGDRVLLDNQNYGKIKHVGMRSTRIVTPDQETIIVPNTKLAENNILNTALPAPKLRIRVPFGVAYGTKVENLKKIIKKEVKKITMLSKEEDILIRFLKMGESSLDFEAVFYIEDYDVKMEAIDEANTLIYNVLNKNGINIPFPQMDVYIKEQAGEKKK